MTTAAERPVAARSDDDHVHALVGTLGGVESDVVEMVYFQGRTFRETARLLAMDEPGVARALSSAFGPIARGVLDH